MFCKFGVSCGPATGSDDLGDYFGRGRVRPKLALFDGHGHQPSYVKVGYFTQWGIYGRNYQLSKVQSSGQAARLTHLNYAFALIEDGRLVSFKDDKGLGLVRGLKTAYPHLKVLISIGGWAAEGFSDAALSAERVTKTAASVSLIQRQICQVAAVVMFWPAADMSAWKPVENAPVTTSDARSIAPSPPPPPPTFLMSTGMPI